MLQLIWTKLSLYLLCSVTAYPMLLTRPQAAAKKLQATGIGHVIRSKRNTKLTVQRARWVDAPTPRPCIDPRGLWNHRCPQRECCKKEEERKERIKEIKVWGAKKCRKNKRSWEKVQILLLAVIVAALTALSFFIAISLASSLSLTLSLSLEKGIL